MKEPEFPSELTLTTADRNGVRHVMETLQSLIANKDALPWQEYAKLLKAHEKLTQIVVGVCARVL